MKRELEYAPAGACLGRCCRRCDLFIPEQPILDHMVCQCGPLTQLSGEKYVWYNGALVRKPIGGF